MTFWAFLLWVAVVLMFLVLLGMSIFLVYIAVKVKRMRVVVDLFLSKPGVWWSWSDIVEGTGLKKSVLVETMDSMVRIGYVISMNDPKAVASQDEAYARAERVMASAESALNDLESIRRWHYEFQAVQEELMEFMPAHLALKQFRFVYKGPRWRHKPKLQEKWSWLWPKAAEGKYQPV